MKGTDCTPEQIEAASTFLADRGWPTHAATAAISRENVACLIAWYGACRYIAARDGTGGTLEQPGVLGVVNRKEVSSMNTNHEGAKEETEKPADQGSAEGAGQTEGEKAGEQKPAPEGD